MIAELEINIRHVTDKTERGFILTIYENFKE